MKKNDDPFDYTTHNTFELPENKGVCFKIEYGIKNPTFTFYITLEQFENNLKIFDYIPANYSSWAEMGTLPVLNLQKSFNSKAYRIKLWNFIEKTAKSLEN